MADQTASSSFGNLDWSKFDFTRWNFEGLDLDDSSSAVATLLQKVITAPQWPQAFGSTLPGLKNVVIEHLKAQMESLGKSSATLDEELAARTTATQSLINALQGKIRQGSLPPTPAASLNLFQLVAKAVDQRSQLGLPGLTVQLLDASGSGKVVASANTDSNGNAILSLSPKEVASETEGKAGDLTLTILSSAGKSLYSVANAVCAHANQVETHIASIPSSDDTAPTVQFAAEQNDNDTSLLNSLTAKLERLKSFYATQQEDLRAEIAQLQSTIKDIEAELQTTSTS